MSPLKGHTTMDDLVKAKEHTERRCSEYVGRRMMMMELAGRQEDEIRELILCEGGDKDNV